MPQLLTHVEPRPCSLCSCSLPLEQSEQTDVKRLLAITPCYFLFFSLLQCSVAHKSIVLIHLNSTTMLTLLRRTPSYLVMSRRVASRRVVSYHVASRICDTFLRALVSQLGTCAGIHTYTSWMHDAPIHHAPVARRRRIVPPLGRAILILQGTDVPLPPALCHFIFCGGPR